MKTFQKSAVISAFLVIGLTTIFLFSTGFKKIEDNHQKPTTHIVTIHQMKFDPENIKVKKGDIVEWINKDIVPHDVTEVNKKWKSKPLNQGEKFSKVMTGNVDYFCSIHIVMKGSVTLIK